MMADDVCLEDGISQKQLDELRQLFYVRWHSKAAEMGTKSIGEQRRIALDILRPFFPILELPESFLDSHEIKELVDEYVLFIGNPERPKDCSTANWKPWLTDEMKKGFSWRYRERYFKYLSLEKHWNADSINSLDVCSEDILQHCGDPKAASFNIKGLVVGDIQSGKTASYTALINSALDVGYKVIVVLTGTTNDLRAQTQRRLDKEVAGFQTQTTEEEKGIKHRFKGDDYGVSRYGKVTSELCILTNGSESGDLKTTPGYTHLSEQSPAYMAILKKNKKSIQEVTKFLQNTNAYQESNDGKFPFPVLLIDDEADLASPNTKKETSLEMSNTTNRLIRKLIFQNCRCVTYVGYTATPFANVFIKPRDNIELSEDDADDIFPDDFIITLPTPPDYSGPQDYFGITGDSIVDDGNVKLDLIDYIPNDDVEILSSKLQDGDFDRQALRTPESLREAMMSFLISTGAKISRGMIANYTMLINVAVRVNFNAALKDSVKEEFERICRDFKYDQFTRNKFKEYWETHFAPISKRRLSEEGNHFTDTWGKVEEGISQAIEWKTDDSVKLVVGRNDADYLDYASTKHGIYVVVGGQKLSRGLTLDGLSVSYYLREARNVDTLLQMGRWFGYRKGWLDLCRIFTTKQIVDDYIEATIVVESFKKQIEEMNVRKATPRTFGLCIQSTARLLPTARNKARGSLLRQVSFSGSLSQMLEFDKAHKEANFRHVEEFLRSLSMRGCAKPRNDVPDKVFAHVPKDSLISFLNGFQCPDNTILEWRDYIEMCNQSDELMDWTVILASKKERAADKEACIAGYEIYKPSRVLRVVGGNSANTLKLRVLTAPGTYLGFFPNEVDTTPIKDGYNPENGLVRQYFTPRYGILGIYVFDPKNKGDNRVVDGAEGTVGLAIWFPPSKVYKKEWVYANPVEVERLEREKEAMPTAAEERTT